MLFKPVTCVAILAVRNEALHMHRALSSFIEQGIDVVVIDHESTDRTLEICKELLGKGILFIERLPWRGVFDLSEQLDAKARIIEKLQHDWVIHADADEWLQSPVKGESLLEGITRVDGLGYNAINFEEFVFLPNPNESDDLLDYNKKLLYYYYFSPQRKRLMRAWKMGCEFRNNTTGGHKLEGNDLNLAPVAFILRHYIVLSQRHAVKKYGSRVFSDIDLKKGWHGNRLQLDAKRLTLPKTCYLKKLACWDDVNFDRSNPKQTHYWDW